MGRVLPIGQNYFANLPCNCFAPQKIYLGNVFYGSNVVKDDLNFCFIGRINGVQFSRALFQEQLRWKSFQLELLAITTELSKWYLHIKLIFLG